MGRLRVAIPPCYPLSPHTSNVHKLMVLIEHHEYMNVVTILARIFVHKVVYEINLKENAHGRMLHLEHKSIALIKVLV